MIELGTALAGALDIVKKLNALNEKIKDADIKMLIADLNIELADAKNDIAKLITENQRLKTEIDNLKNDKFDKLQFKNGAYYDTDGNGPFCPGCYDGKNKKSRLVENNPDFNFIGNYQCSVCGKMFKVKE
jgi:regulator of replication initiation timing